MTYEDLARSYITKAGKRVRVLEVLFEDGAYSDVVREAQELVELALKGMLRLVGVDPPKWHDVGPILKEQIELFPRWLHPEVPRLAEISRWLRKEREFAFYGDIDFIPTEEYTRKDAERAMQDAAFVLDLARRLLSAVGGEKP